MYIEVKQKEIEFLIKNNFFWIENSKHYICCVPHCNEVFSSWLDLFEHSILSHIKISQNPHKKVGHISISSSTSNSNTIMDLTGLKYYIQRPIACFEVQCTRRFKRDYDLKRHIVKCHSKNLCY